MKTDQKKIIYTLTDEAPALATESFLPIVKAFSKAAGIDIETRDISLAARILSQFPEHLSTEQQRNDDLAYLGQLVKESETNIIKLPNISASIPQLTAAIKELQNKGFNIPDYPEQTQTEPEAATKAKYAKVLGSAVNPVLREGNSDRRVPLSVKQYAKANPHHMGEWSKDSKTRVVSMEQGDFYGSEKSITLDDACEVIIKFIADDGTEEILTSELKLQTGEIIDASVMQQQQLKQLLKSAYQQAKDSDCLASVHLKATMMKVSDPIIFGHAVSVYFQEVFDKYKETFASLDINPNNGLGDLYQKIKQLSEQEQANIQKDIDNCFKQNADLAMVDSDNNITNLHVPSHVIIDASMPAMIRNGGKMWNKEGKQQDTLAIIPDRCYAGIYQASIEFCQEQGAFNPATMGTVANIGLMAQKAEEYGSHDKTFQLSQKGKVCVIKQSGLETEVLLEHDVESGDIWRMCQVKDAPIQDWVKLAVKRATLTKVPTIFWLDPNRAHDREIKNKVTEYLKQYDTSNLDIQVLSPVEATKLSLAYIKENKDVISVTGNVLRDYLTDLFPILELGTSAKMLSIVPLMNGGGLFETGAGGSAPKHVQQLINENHLRWDSLGEFLALAVSLEHLSQNFNDVKAKILSQTLDQATGKLLLNNHSPSYNAGELDNRGSHFYISLYWSQALTEQDESIELQQHFEPIFTALTENKDSILKTLIDVQQQKVDIGGYYLPDSQTISNIMRPSEHFNRIIKG
ncbi:MAG: NADP-dependent isocitrate dehydrogenase [Gammaproteobacteria bacterium]|nr:NADP-dependent isocitrate dehydrogenase [Gammaproteobacteria bacterium]